MAQITDKTAEQAANALRDQERRHLEGAEGVRSTEPGGLIYDPEAVAQMMEEEAQRDREGWQEIERTLGYEIDC